MTSRSADATIKGYYYQFDTSILELLNLPKDVDFITVEDIEDIDVHTLTGSTAIQCKYLSQSHFTNSSVREPITLMLDHFVNPHTPSNYKYRLYAHFENEILGTEPTIDLIRLKEILTYKEKKSPRCHYTERGITDTQLTAFLSNFKLIFGEDFDLQQTQILSKIKTHFSCTEFEADTYYYNNALRVIINKAIQKDIANRKVTKSEFLKEINCQKKLFSIWYIKLRSKNEWLKLASKNLKLSRTLDPVKVKYISIGKEILAADNTELPLHIFIENLIAKYYRLNYALHDSKPLTLIFEIDSTDLRNLKKRLINSEVSFNDGHEEIEFSASAFNNKPIINTNSAGNKIAKSSYLIKVVSMNSILPKLPNITPPKVHLNFSKEDTPINFREVQFIDFKYCENLKDVFNILTS